MKIAFVAYDRPSYRAGPIVNVRRLLPELAQRGHNVTAMILFRGGGSPASDWLRERGVDVVASPWLGTTQAHIRWYLTQLRKIEPDVFVPNISTAGWFAARWCREVGIATISAHRSDERYYWAMVDQFVTGPEEWAVSGCVCVSRDLAARVKALSPKNTQVRTICSGVPVPPQMAVAGVECFRIVYVGRLEQVQKRILETVEGLIQVLRSDQKFQFTIIGVGSRRPDIEKKVCDSGVGDRIRILGAIEPHALHDELLQHHVLVLLSDFEGMPGCVMDGMACGLVPVCTGFAGITELVSHMETGIIVEDRDKSLVSAMRLLADDKELWTRLSRAARAKVEMGFSLSRTAEKWEDFCVELTAGLKKQAIIIPSKFDLPRVHPDLAREDFRAGIVPVAIRTATMFRRLSCSAMSKIVLKGKAVVFSQGRSNLTRASWSDTNRRSFASR